MVKRRDNGKDNSCLKALNTLGLAMIMNICEIADSTCGAVASALLANQSQDRQFGY